MVISLVGAIAEDEIEFISKKSEIFFEKKELKNLMEIISKKYLNIFLKGSSVDNHFAVDIFFLLMSLVKFDFFLKKLKICIIN